MATTMQESEPRAASDAEPPVEIATELSTEPRPDLARVESPEPVPPVPLPLTDKALLYSCAMTYREYVAASPRQEFFAIRAREIRLLPEEQRYSTDYPHIVHWLIVVDDGPDTLVTLPVIAHVAAWVPRLSLRVVRDDEATPLLAALVEDDALLAQWAEADLPLLLMFDDEWRFQEQWGPHPQAMDGYLESWLAAHGEYDQLVESLAEGESATQQAAFARLQEALLQEMRVWYNSALNQAGGEELRALLARWHDENADGNGDENGDEMDDVNGDDRRS